MLVPHQDGTI